MTTFRTLLTGMKNLFNSAQEEIPMAKELSNGVQVVAVKMQWKTQPLQQGLPPSIQEALEISQAHECNNVSSQEIDQWALLRARAENLGLRGGDRKEFSGWTYNS